jgi:hypothetical protein
MNNSMNEALAPVVATPEMTRAALLDGQTRLGPPIRAAFLQERGGQRAPGALHRFVNGRRLFGLQLYLLLHTVALADPWDGWLPAAVWGRALDHEGRGAEATVSRNWDWMEDLALVTSRREKRMRRVFLLREDGSGEAYSRPKGHFFYVPLAYFRDDWYSKLSLAGTAVLLIGLSLEQPFQLRTEHAAGWYGVSADTLQRGLDELRDHQLLTITPRRIPAPKLRQGWTVANEYRLQGAFARQDRVTTPAGVEA